MRADVGEGVTENGGRRFAKAESDGACISLDHVRGVGSPRNLALALDGVHT